MYSMESEREYGVKVCVYTERNLVSQCVQERLKECNYYNKITRVGKQILQEVVGFQDKTGFLASKSTS